jgi:hypothetical protein
VKSGNDYETRAAARCGRDFVFEREEKGNSRIPQVISGWGRRHLLSGGLLRRLKCYRLEVRIEPEVRSV